MHMALFEARSSQEHEVFDTLRLGVLISNKGTGSNLQAIIDTIGRKELSAIIPLVVSDKVDAKGLERARNYSIPWKVLTLAGSESRDSYSLDLAKLLNLNGVEVSVFAGFGTILTDSYLREFRGLTINVHPGLVPDNENEPVRFPDGTVAPWNRRLMTEKAVANFLGGTYAGSTIHIVTNQVDFGPVLTHKFVETEAGDTVDTLYGRLKLAENEGLIESLQGLYRSLRKLP